MNETLLSRLLLCAVSLAAGCYLTLAAPTWAQDGTGPVIDMHLHAKHANELGPPPLYLCAPFSFWPVKDALEDPQI